MANSELVSVIVPVYNLADYLNRSLQSIVAQSYQKIEIIVVDDGSNVNTKDIEKSWVAKDSRIKLVELEGHEGVSVSRNRGIIESKGEFISFVDGDDIIEPNFIETLVNGFDEETAMTVVGYSWGGRWSRQEVTHSGWSNISRSDMYSRSTRHGDPIGGYVWNKMFRRSVIIQNNIQFDESLEMAEDLLFTADYVFEAKYPKFKFLSESLYNKVNRSSSIIHSATFEMREREHEVEKKIHARDDKINE
ncbi:glycosyltransferase family 2 protein [Pediococcus claussenii]|uniref:Glycosyl transferase 2 family protein n=1 Tax=Pediococcus claussenii (strain ATCC BAA-344 / DSM 14800 / JCM 18046 / KCTC 3811 / LMG 21948 / P06) TaxID=701521 RepID=G8PAL3_PEDCP|nr:glycosyltransferase family A protein [Pediococcus claussenii]AEV95802.1 glycosyl transferase 2 family protein [Pediococcus claussenii ATCC BAA-344]ANZ69300.1 hypothetical protein AYR57_02835 [Pediococcus claussenii]ANZ71120.1 hypothetical protein AYR58_02850 [Pediococcus claussenii]KRN20409.1 hypothetical protein IV79_GL000464 [Pediococcus claussenii]